jgi:predicted metal-dependent hydrolase
MEAREAEEKFRRGLAQFNRREFFAAHETWEEIWLASSGPEKTFLQGVIQVAAAFHHHSRGNLKGTRSLLEAGLKKLEKSPATHRGCEVEKLRAAARGWIAALREGKDPGARKLPRIRRKNSGNQR